MRISNALRTLVCALLATVAVLAIPAAANAGSRQLSLMQDDSELFGDRGEDPAGAMREMKDLGVDVVRTNVLFYRVYTRINDRVKPTGFDTSDPDEPLYDWSKTDRIVSLAKQNGLKLLLTVSGPGPHWSSEQPSRCRTNKICSWKPDAADFGQFTAAVAKRYRGQADWYSLFNEPNIETHTGTPGWITPQIKRTKAGVVQLAGVYYRKLWLAGYKAIAANDPARRGRVLFGEVAAISAPLPKLYAALCLDGDGRPFKGKLRKLQKCGGHVAKLPIGGWAIHPYNQGGFGSPRRKTSSRTALPQQYLPRLHQLIKRAAGRGRVPGGRGIYVTEFGYQTNPPDHVSNISPQRQAQYINESDRLFFSDPLVKTVAQYQLVDVREADQYNSGLRFAGGAKKPSYDAYRLPIVVTRHSARSVEVYGQIRPLRQARLVEAFTTPELQFAKPGGSFKTVMRPATNSVGIFRVEQRRSGAAAGRWRIKWQDLRLGLLSYSRVAKAGKPLRFYRD